MRGTPAGDPAETPARRRVRTIGPFLTLGMQLALSVVVFFFIGRWLDGLWGTTPWLMLAGLILGMAGGFLQFFRAVNALGKQEEEERRNRESTGGNER
jgi:ATP synthase protein I